MKPMIGNKKGMRLFFVGAIVLVAVLMLSVSTPAWATPLQNPLSQTVLPGEGQISKVLVSATGGDVTDTANQFDLNVPAGAVATPAEVQYLVTDVPGISGLPSGASFTGLAVKIQTYNPTGAVAISSLTFSPSATALFWGPSSAVSTDMMIATSTTGTSWVENTVTIIPQGTAPCSSTFVPSGSSCVKILLGSLSSPTWFALVSHPAPVVVISAPAPTPTALPAPTATPVPTPVPPTPTVGPGTPTPTPPPVTPSPTPVVGKVAQSITAAAGGTLTSADKNVKVTVDAGTVYRDSSLTYAPSTVAEAPKLPEKVVFAAQPFKLDLFDAAGTSQTGVVLAKPLTITVKVTPDILKAAGNQFGKIVIRKYVEASKQWVSLVTTYNPITNEVSANVSTLSLFALTIEDPVGPSPIETPTPVPTPTAKPPVTGDYAPGTGSLAATALLGMAMLISGGVFLSRSRRREDAS